MRGSLGFLFCLTLLACAGNRSSTSDAAVAADAEPQVLDAQNVVDAQDAVDAQNAFDGSTRVDASVRSDASIDLGLDLAAAYDAAPDGRSDSGIAFELVHQRVAAGDNQSCAIVDDGKVKCWGGNGDGVLGLGDTLARGDGPGEMGSALAYVSLPTGRTALSITAGSMHTCVLLDSHDVMCWGANTSGQLGLGDVSSRGDDANELGDFASPVDLGTGRMALAITAGVAHTCALFDNGDVKCWGYNFYGQLGLGDANNRGDGSGEMGDALPIVSLGTGRHAIAVAAGGTHTCAVLDDATLKCWGYNSIGQLGLLGTSARGDASGEMGDALPAVNVGTARNVAAVSAGFFHTCATFEDGDVKCWGFNVSGQLGLGDTDSRGTTALSMGDMLPLVSLGSSALAVSVSAGSNSTCVLLATGALKCWGANAFGQLAQGDVAARGDNVGEMGDALSAIDLGAGRHAIQVSTGTDHTCALLDDDSIKCWGNNDYGQLGQGDTTNRGDNSGELGSALLAIDL